MIDDRPRVFTFDDSRAEFCRKLRKAERASLFRHLTRGRGCAAGGADRPPNRPASPARILDHPKPSAFILSPGTVTIFVVDEPGSEDELKRRFGLQWR